MFPFTTESSGNFQILRDDLVAGGTKRRALQLLVKNIASDRIAYAGTTMGHGALALAHACAANGKSAEIYISGDAQNPMIGKLRTAGAILHLQPPLPVDALFEMAGKEGGTVLPPGFDMPEFEQALIHSLQEFSAATYSEIWTCSVTGTLTRAIKRAFPDKIIKTVSVVKSGGPCDFAAPEKYHQPAKNPPPYPSCPYTDAKAWQFAASHAADNALIWNTAG